MVYNKEPEQRLILLQIVFFSYLINFNGAEFFIAYNILYETRTPVCAGEVKSNIYLFYYYYYPGQTDFGSG